MKKCLFFGLVLMMLAGWPQTAGAERSLRCGTDLVSVGAPMYEVLGDCGEPDWRDQWEEYPQGNVFRIFDYTTERYHLPRLILGPLRMERWIYNQGANRFVRYLTFENEILIRIRTGNKP